MKSFITLFFALLFTSVFYGQRLFGTVTDAKTDEPIAGVNVFIKSIKKGVTSKNNGIFYFEQAHGLKKQDTILFNMVGYHTLKLTLEEYDTLEKKVRLVEENFSRNRSSNSTGRIITLGKSNNSIK
ncbi:carboxypeptidase-like regulatory domain-containing protein [Leeuwenhoekiella marinoflava]|uniref:Carboxypeptidase-like protein n=2 Tax=Leeuwenhoekiella marinoflava TaxID=988 RepID=A0A4V1KS25_9FLAO|nr:carboxypeptidase-like regulatory domain-containing protein [Leeuwenhoekiella marinoflava]RXG27053.1 carboxypeptidase-like protein [Leeuwenhoekiella marinoflava]SHF43086.1 CarboxypepD_reg-like domain-containing protein [Leeuwenhoekiella marinoflava DSM 3653]